MYSYVLPAYDNHTLFAKSSLMGLKLYMTISSANKTGFFLNDFKVASTLGHKV